MYQLVKHHCVTKLGPNTQGILELRTCFCYSGVNMWTSKASGAWLNPYRIYFHLFLPFYSKESQQERRRFTEIQRTSTKCRVHSSSCTLALADLSRNDRRE